MQDEREPAATAGSGADAGTAAEQDLVQYVLVRGDLLGQEGWSVGSLIAQGIHGAC